MTLLHANATARSVVVFARYIFAIWLLKFFVDPFEDLASLPFEYASVVGILKLVPEPILREMLDVNVLFGTRVAIVVLCFACLFRRAFLLAAPLACVLITAQQSLTRSYGHINHTEVPLLLAAFVLTVFAFAEARRSTSTADDDPAYNRHAAPLVTVALLLCLTYSMVGMTRLVTGGFEIFLSDSIVKLLLDQAYHPWLIEFPWGREIYDWPLLVLALKLGFPIATTFEVLAPVCLVSRRFRVVFIVVMLGFHLMNLLLMKLPFFETMLLLAILIDTPWRPSRTQDA